MEAVAKSQSRGTAAIQKVMAMGTGQGAAERSSSPLGWKICTRFNLK